MITYNQYLTKGINDGTIPYREQDGVRVYMVRKPLPGEEVVGYTNFSDFMACKTPTGMAQQGDV